MTGRSCGTALAALATACLTLVGCGSGAGSGSLEASGLEHAYPTKEALARAVLAGLEVGDREAMEELLVTRREHRELLWPELPERTYLTFEEARAINERNTRHALNQAMSRYGGRSFELVSLEFTERSEVYEGFTLHRGAELTARWTSTGEVVELPILRVVLEKNGYWKLMHFDE